MNIPAVRDREFEERTLRNRVVGGKSSGSGITYVQRQRSSAREAYTPRVHKETIHKTYDQTSVRCENPTFTLSGHTIALTNELRPRICRSTPDSNCVPILERSIVIA